MSRYLSPEPLLQNPKVVLSELQAGRQMPAYGYAGNNPITNYDSDGNLTRQYRRDGKGSAIVRGLEAPLREELVEQCKKEAENNESECKKKNKACNPSPPKGTGLGDLKELEATIEAGTNQCIKGANCEYEACLAGATSASGTTDYRIAWSKCMSRP